MPKVTYEQLMSDLKKRQYQAVYFMTGDEPFYIDRATNYIMENVLSKEEQAFNMMIFYGKDSDTNTIIDTARRYPMMASHQVVIVKEAQELKAFDNFLYYLEKPLKSTILVINYKLHNNKTIDRRKKIFKSLENNSVFFESKKLYDDKIPVWISSYLENKGYRIEMKAAAMLTDFLGNDLSKIVNELDKLLISFTGEHKLISASDVENNIGISKEYNNYELQNALAGKNILKANRIINYFADNQKNNNIVVTLASLYFFFSKILIYHSLKDKSRSNAAFVLKIPPNIVSEYQLAATNYSSSKVIEIISLLREYDLKSKGFNSPALSAGDILKELIYKILH